jgi:hypothetical protein
MSEQKKWIIGVLLGRVGFVLRRVSEAPPG